ncbi:patatin-like phospholipase family protein [Thiomicrorhabdus sp. Kp2]|uniref:patatin-like phospholipase family protein n=1 Tax=Thiomicrorhabdus sp. Kp2 TaxID=1123518 RepID=UPI000424AB36|nr:patatin-like phospholipase family protein [Thiomicrorhabdus sp. Kp2]
MSKPKQFTQTTKTVSLILGSGGARGLAHIGVIRWLEEHNYQINFISGSSMGALIGGVYAVGKLDEFETWFKKLGHTDILGLADIAWDSSGLIKGDKLFNQLEELIGHPNIEDLTIPFTAVATDIENEKEVWIQKGPLLEAVRASIALPMIFTPFHRHGLTLIDGGVLNPIPIAPTFSQTNDLTIAVNLGGKPKTNQPKTVEKPNTSQDDSWLNNASELFNSLIKRFRPDKKSNLASFNWDMYDISNKAFDSMQSTIARQKLAAYPPDIVLEIPRDACGMLEFTKVNEMIELGYQTAQQSLSD